jgi:hypothetical protein
VKSSTSCTSRLICRRITLAVLSAVAIGLCAPKPAAASSCSTYLGNINKWFLTEPQGNGYYNVLVTMIEMNTGRSYATYAEGSPSSGGSGQGGTLTYHAAAGGYPAYIQDAGAKANSIAEYFSDRRYSEGGLQASYPFNPAATDNLGMKFYLQDDSAKSITAGETILTLYSWGNATATFPTTCTNGMLYGFNSNDEMFAFQLTEQYLPPPPPLRTRRRSIQGRP